MAEIPDFFTERNSQVWVTGSTMYGMNTPDSDVDFTGVYHSSEEYLNPFLDRDKTLTSNNNDYSLHTAAKFARMLVKGNFNAIDLVFHEPEVENAFVKLLLDRVKPHVLTQAVASSYMGYIFNQKDRLIGHKPQSPERKEQIAKLGYDPKYAAHLLRGMNTLYHLLETGEYLYLDGELLRILVDIKLGNYHMSEVASEIDTFLPNLRDSYEKNLERLKTTDALIEESKRVFLEYAAHI